MTRGKKRRGRLPKHVKENRERAERSTEAIMTALQDSAAWVFGDEAKFTDEEHDKIETPLERVIERLDPEWADWVAQFTDPILLFFALLAWGRRVWKLADEQAEQRERERQQRIKRARAGVSQSPPSPEAETPENPPSNSTNNGQGPVQETSKDKLRPPDPKVVEEQLSGGLGE